MSIKVEIFAISFSKVAAILTAATATVHKEAAIHAEANAIFLLKAEAQAALESNFLFTFSNTGEALSTAVTVNFTFHFAIFAKVIF